MLFEEFDEKALAELMEHAVDFEEDCPRCTSDEVQETGYGRSYVGLPVSRWLCSECGHTFFVYEGSRWNGRLVTEEDER